MYNFLKPLLKVVGYVPPEKEEPSQKIKTRVRPFYTSSSSSFYVAEYFHDNKWYSFTEDDPLANKRVNSPKLDRSFDNLVLFCKKFTKYSQIEEYQKKNIFEEKTWESE